MKARRLPADDAHCGWFEGLPDPPPPRRLRGELRVDTAVVGAGFTGLAAARRLAELAPEREVALLDAQRAGFGAAGRSSGFVVDLAGFIATLEPADADRFVDLSRLAIRLLKERVDGHGIDCQWDDSGWLHVAATDAGERSLSDLRRWLDRRGEPSEDCDAAGMEAVTGSRYYRDGLRLPGSVLVQPAALARGLAASLPEAVGLWEQTPVLAIHPGSPAVVETAAGKVVADHVLVGTNGLMPTLGVLRQRVFPLWTFGSLTRPLEAAEQAVLGGEREWGVLAQDVLGSSLRRTRDQRILVRNTVHFSRATAARGKIRDHARQEHERAFRLRFPKLAARLRADGPLFSHTWGGVMGMSANGRHHFGELAKNVWGAAGYNAAGIALGTVSGHLLADAARGHDSPHLRAMRALPGPRWFPPSPFSDLGIQWRIRGMEAASGGEV